MPRSRRSAGFGPLSLVVALLALAGCGGSSHQADSPTVTSPTDAASASGSPATSSPSPDATGSSATASSGPSGGMTSSPTAAPTSSATTGGRAARPSGLARPGTYHYDETGTSHSAFGDENLAGVSTLTVGAIEGTRQRSETSGKNGSQTLTVDSLRAGLYLDDIAIDSQGFKEEFTPSPAVLYFPVGAKARDSWHWTAMSNDRHYTLTVTSTIRGTQAVTVGGRSVLATVVDSVLRINGNGIDMTVKQRDWASRSFGLVLKEHAATSGTAYGTAFSSDVTRTLRSTSPS